MSFRKLNQTILAFYARAVSLLAARRATQLHPSEKYSISSASKEFACSHSLACPVNQYSQDFLGSRAGAVSYVAGIAFSFALDELEPLDSGITI